VESSRESVSDRGESSVFGVHGSMTPFQLENGPIEAAREDWFQVSSPVFGRGWILAEFLVGTPLALDSTIPSDRL